MPITKLDPQFKRKIRGSWECFVQNSNVATNWPLSLFFVIKAQFKMKLPKLDSYELLCSYALCFVMRRSKMLPSREKSEKSVVWDANAILDN